MEKKLYRSPKDGILVGIASGLGHYFGKDPVLIRVIIVVLALVLKVWPVAVLYVIAFFIIPVDPAQAKVEPHQQPKDVTGDEPPAKSQEPSEEKRKARSHESSVMSQERIPSEEKKEEPTSAESERKAESAPTERMDSGQNM